MAFATKFILILLCLFIVVYFIIAKLFKGNQYKKVETIGYNEIEELFFEKIKNGSYPYKLLSIYVPFDDDKIIVFI